jgi:hypothetical protein
MAETQHYRVVVNADRTGLRELQVFPPPDPRIADYLYAGLQQRVDVANDRPKGYVNTPKSIEHDTYGSGTSFFIINCIQPKTLKRLSHYLIEMLNAEPGNLTDLTYNLELDEEYLASQPLLEDAPVKPEYL